MLHPFLKEACLSNEYISDSFPLANHTAHWQPLNTHLTNWILPHSETVAYDFNHLGYRGSWTEADLDNSIWCFGDSQTAGMGLHEQQLWTTQLAALLDRKTINLGIAGASNDTIARTLLSATKHYRPSAVCVLMTAPNRREIICDLGRSTFFPTATKFIDKLDKKLFNMYLDSIDDTSNSVNYDKNLILMQTRCQALGIPFVALDFTVHVWELAQQDAAVDGLHLGPKIHQEVAEFYKNKLQ